MVLNFLFLHLIQRRCKGNNPLNNNSSTDKPSTIQLVAPEDYLIGKDTLNSLQQANHQILLHTSWISPTNKLVSGLRIHLLGGNIYPDQQNTTPLPANSTSTNDPTNNDSSQAIHQIEGQIKLNLNRYFNFNINLVMTEPTAKLQRIDANFNQDNTRGTWSYFQLTQQRRMRSRELNYIDHPLYGMLILIKPITAQQATHLQQDAISERHAATLDNPDNGLATNTAALTNNKPQLEQTAAATHSMEITAHAPQASA